MKFYTILVQELAAIHGETFSYQLPGTQPDELNLTLYVQDFHTSPTLSIQDSCTKK